MKTETCACQVGRELRSTSSQAVRCHPRPHAVRSTASPPPVPAWSAAAAFMKTETCACQVGRELRSTSSQAVLPHTSPALDSPARPRRPIDRPHGRSRLQADSPSNSSTSRGWWADSRAHLADSLAHLAHPRAHLARFRVHLVVSRAHLCLVRQRRKWLCIGQSAIAHIGQRLRSPHMPGRVSVCILYAYPD